MKLRELQHKRAAKIAEAQQILDTADGEKRALNDEERSLYDGLMAEIESLAGDIQRAERMLELQDPGNTREEHREGDGNIGMSEKDVLKYSLVRAIYAASEARRDPNAWERIAPFELEASRAVADRLGHDPEGFFVPNEVSRGIARAREMRDLVVGTATAGGNLVATDLLASSFIELLRNKMLLRAAGITILGGLVGDVAIPRQTGGATAYWVGESGSPTESQQTVDQVALTPHTIGAFTDYSRKLLKQSSIDVERFVRNDLAAVLALGIDYAGLHGDHTVDANQPDGVTATSGIGAVVGGTDGLAPAWSHIVGLETEIAVDNADVGRMAYISNPKVRGKLKQTFKNATYGEMPIWDGNTMNGYQAMATNQVRANLDKGNSTGVCSAIFFGNWADLILGMWGELDILVDPYTGSTSGTVRVVNLQDVDFAIRHAQSFSAMLDALTT